MDQTQQRKQKWGFWLYMLNFFSLDSISQLLIKTRWYSDETSFGQQFIAFVISISLTLGLSYLLRSHPWKIKVQVTGCIIVIWLLVHIWSAMR